MRRYTKKAQVLFTEEEYRILLMVAAEEHKALGALLREAAIEVYLRKRRKQEKAKAVAQLLALKETEVPADYQQWERQYLDEKANRHG